MSGLRLRPAGERAVLVELPGNASVRKLEQGVRERLGGLEAVVAGHETLLLRWESGRRPPGDLAARLAELLRREASSAAPSRIEIPVVYDGPDLVRVGEACGHSPEAVVREHLASTFVVGFVGFAPGFAYLLGGPATLQPPRLASPRERIPPGSLAVAGEYTAIYPAASPGGWNLIGRALVPVVGEGPEPRPLLATGMQVRFTEAR